MDARLWYYADAGRQMGPVTEQALQRMLANGRLAPDVMVWTPELEEWTAASDIEGLLPEAPAPAVAAPVVDERQWHYNITGEQVGPVPESVLQKMLQTKKLPHGTLVWTQGMASWVPASSVQGLVPKMVMRVSRDAIETARSITEFQGYAGFWKRWAAAFVDNIVLHILGLPITFIYLSLYGLDALTATKITMPAFYFLIPSYLLSWLYFALFESSKKQATPGKMLLGIKVAKLDGNSISFGQATGRFFIKLLSGFICIIGVVSFFMVIFTKKKQAIHDTTVNCVVVNR